jgi:hypothetical protein
MITMFSRTGRSQVPRGRSLRPAPLLRIAGLLFLFTLLCGNGQADELPASQPDQIKSAYLRNFAHYVIWPANAFIEEHSAWRIGILGDDSFGDLLGKSFAGRLEQGRAFEIVHARTVSELASCQIVFIAEKTPAKRRAVLMELKNKPVLTVSEAPKFLQEGGIIRFDTSDRVQMSINLDQAHAVSLKIPSQMLEVTREVLENGVVRKLR